MENTFQDYIDRSNGIFLLILALCSGFVAETINCKIQYHLTNNRYLKYLVVFFVIYFSITLTSKENVNPFVLLSNALFIWIFFVLFTRMTPIPTIIVLVCLLLVYFINNYRNYLKRLDSGATSSSKKIDDKHRDDTLFNIQKLLMVVLVAIILIGNISYLIKKRNQYGKDFNYLTYIFGVKKCKSLD